MTVTINGTTGVSGVAGSASAPALIGSDADSGYYINSANEPNASVNGTAVWNAASTFGFKNRIINGAMVIDQRNAGAAITGISNGAYYAVDRFPLYNQSSGTWTAQQVTDAPAGFNNSLKLTVTSAGSTGTAAWTSFINAYIEGYNVADIGFGTANCKQTTLSFWVKSSIAGAFTYGLHNANDAWLTNTFTISSANTWQKITIQVPIVSVGTWLTTNGRGLGIFIGLGSGSNYTVSPSNTWYNTSQGSQYFASGAVALGATNGATFQVTGVQFEVGSTATSFDYRPYGTELQLCQRYCFVYSYANTGAAYGSILIGRAASTTVIQGPFTLPAPMRIVPSLTWSGAFSDVDTGASGASISLNNPRSTNTQIFMNVTFSSGAVIAGNASYINLANSTTWSGIFSAEL